MGAFAAIGGAMRLFLLTLFCLTLFASNSIFCRAALVTWGMEPLQYTAVRSLSAAAMLALMCLTRVVKPLEGGDSVWKQAWEQSSWAGTFYLFAYMICFSLAYVDMPSAAGTLIINTSIQFGMVGWAMVQGEFPSRRQTAGLVIAFAGLAALLSPGLTAPPLFSSFLMVVVGLVWSGYTLCGRAAQSGPLAAAGNFFRCAIGGAAVACLAFILEGTAHPMAYVCAVAAGAVATALSYTLWYAVSSRYELVGLSIIQLSVPFITAFLAVLILGEPVTLRLVLCSIPILGGICLALLAKKSGAGRSACPEQH